MSPRWWFYHRSYKTSTSTAPRRVEWHSEGLIGCGTPITRLAPSDGWKRIFTSAMCYTISMQKKPRTFSQKFNEFFNTQMLIGIIVGLVGLIAMQLLDF